MLWRFFVFACWYSSEWSQAHGTEGYSDRGWLDAQCCVGWPGFVKPGHQLISYINQCCFTWDFCEIFPLRTIESWLQCTWICYIIQLSTILLSEICTNLALWSTNLALWSHRWFGVVVLLASDRLPDGLTRRGDINVLLLGDPGTAKSQLLKFVENCSPIGVSV